MRKVFAVVLAICFHLSVANAQFLGPQSLSQSSYVIDKDGNLWTWGWNAVGQLGIGNTTDQAKPVMVPKPSGVTTWTLVAGGAQHALAVADSTKLYAWGYNGDGELGDGTLAGKWSPQLIPNPTGVTAWKWVSAGADHSLALATNGQLYAWGSNAFGQLGTGTASITPKQVVMPSGVSQWMQVAAGQNFTLAIADDHRTYGWGFDTSCPNLRIGGTSFRMNNSTPVLMDTSGSYSTVAPLTPIGAGDHSFIIVQNRASNEMVNCKSYHGWHGGGGTKQCGGNGCLRRESCAHCLE